MIFEEKPPKPKTIEAVYYDGSNQEEVIRFVQWHFDDNEARVLVSSDNPSGTYRIVPNSYVTRETLFGKGEYYSGPFRTYSKEDFEDKWKLIKVVEEECLHFSGR